MSELPYLLVSILGLVYIYSSQLLRQKLRHRYNQPVFSTFFGVLFSIGYYLATNQSFFFEQQF